MDSNTFWISFGTAKMFTKSGHFLFCDVEMLQQIQENYGNTLPDFEDVELTFSLLFSKSGGSKTIGFSERVQRILRWWDLDEFWKSEIFKNIKT